MVKSRTRRRWWKLLLFSGLGVLAVFLAVFVWPLLSEPRPPVDETPVTVNIDAGGLATVTAGTKITLQETYSFCQHSVSTPVEVGPVLMGLTLEQLQARYLASQIKIDGPDRITIQQTRIGFCPADAAKRHLGVVNNQVAIYVGPIGNDRQLEKITSISVSLLPAELKEQLYQGVLEFANVEELQPALDNLDEYQ